MALGTIVNVVHKEGRSAYGFIVADGENEEDPSARFYFDSRGCLDSPSELLTKLSGARVRFDVKPGDGPKPFAVNVRVLAPNVENGIITSHCNGKQVFGFVQDGWGESYYFSPSLTGNFSELRKGNRVSFEVSRRKGKPAARNLTLIK